MIELPSGHRTSWDTSASIIKHDIIPGKGGRQKSERFTLIIGETLDLQLQRAERRASEPEYKRVCAGTFR